MMRRYLTEAEQRALLAAPKGVACPLAQRDYHCLAALMLTGMRITEWSRLTVSMVKQAMATGWLVSPPEHCKGKRGNEYLVTEQLHVHLAALCKLSDQLGAGLVVPAAGQPLVWGRDIAGRAGPLSVRSYEVRLKEWARAAGLDVRISPHWLRHTRGMNIMRRSRGAHPLKVAQVALGHKSIASTGIYTQLAREEVEAELRQVDGGRLPKAVARRLALRGGVVGGVAV
jgi:site-specific recombinase XerD